MITMLVTVLARDPVLRVRRDYSGLSMTLEQAQKETSQREGAKEEEDQLWLSQLWATREGLKPAESIVPFGDSRP